jgi:gluconolactonase
MDPRTSALLVVEKQRMSAFNSTTLDTKLRGLGASTIVVCGAWTNFAIEHTCRDGADHGYEVVLAADATATISDEWQQAALSYALTRIAEVRTVDEVIAELGA